MPRRTRIPALRNHTRCEFCGAGFAPMYGCDCSLSQWVTGFRNAFPGLIVEKGPTYDDTTAGRTDQGERSKNDARKGTQRTGDADDDAS